jgi:DNA repair protein RAD51
VVDSIQSLPITALETCGISANDTKKLKEAGFYTIESIVFTSKKNMIQIKGLTEQKIDKIIENSLKLLP